jgi:hypothetical protein
VKKEFFQSLIGCIAICSALIIWHQYSSGFIRIHVLCMSLVVIGMWLLGKGILKEERFYSFEIWLEEWATIFLICYLVAVLFTGKIDMPFFPYFEKQP